MKGKLFRPELPPAGSVAWANARREARLSQIHLASRVGVTARTLRNLEGGNEAVSLAVRRVVALELFIALGRDPFEPTPTQEVVSDAS